MKNKTLLFLGIISLCFIGMQCKKGSSTPTDPCAGVTVTVQATVSDATGAGGNGSIVVTTPVGSGVTYSLNGAAAVSNATFSSLATGVYTITAKTSSGCSGSAQFTVNTDACAGKTITVSTPTIVGATPCSASPTGSVTVSATGSTGFTYNLGTGAFQASPTFNGLNAGTYTVGAKDVDGCIKTSSVTVSNVAAGPLFTAVKGVIQANCVSCHSGGSPSGGVSLATDCDIVNRWDRIKARAVDGTPSFMPQGGPMPIAERNKITNWVNAGHRYTD
jgi:hypothetical protein